MRGRLACFNASQARSISMRTARERPATVEFLTILATSRTASKSPFEAIGKPASMTSTPISSRSVAMRIFSSRFIDAPGDCSPSRNVVSKMMTRSDLPALVTAGRDVVLTDFCCFMVALMGADPLLMNGKDG